MELGGKTFLGLGEQEGVNGEVMRRDERVEKETRLSTWMPSIVEALPGLKKCRHKIVMLCMWSKSAWDGWWSEWPFYGADAEARVELQYIMINYTIIPFPPTTCTHISIHQHFCSP